MSAEGMQNTDNVGSASSQPVANRGGEASVARPLPLQQYGGRGAPNMPGPAQSSSSAAASSQALQTSPPGPPRMRATRSSTAQAGPSRGTATNIELEGIRRALRLKQSSSASAAATAMTERAKSASQEKEGKHNTSMEHIKTEIYATEESDEEEDTESE